MEIENITIRISRVAAGSFRYIVNEKGCSSGRGSIETEEKAIMAALSAVGDKFGLKLYFK